MINVTKSAPINKCEFEERNAVGQRLKDSPANESGPPSGRDGALRRPDIAARWYLFSAKALSHASLEHRPRSWVAS